MKISFLNESTPEYGAHETMMYYYNYAKKNGYDARWNEYNDDIDFYVMGMAHQKALIEQYLKPNKFIYMEHSIEMLLPFKKWIRKYVIPNAYKIYFMSPRHKEHIMSAMGGDIRIILEGNSDLLVVPVDYELFKLNPNIVRIKNMYLFVGLIDINKGVEEILKLAKENSYSVFIFVGKEHESFDIRKFDDYKNIHYYGHMSKEKLPEVYNMAKYICLLPQCGAVESASRVIFEGVLCGCKPIVNNNVGNASWEWYQEPTEIIKNVKLSTENLFKTIEEGILK